MRSLSSFPFFPCTYFDKPDALAACTSAPVKRSTFLSVTKHTDRIVQFLMKGVRGRFSMHATRQQCVVMKRRHRPLLIDAQFALVHVGAHRDGTFQSIEGFLRLFAAHHF